MPYVEFDHEEFVVSYDMNLYHQCLDHFDSLLENEHQEWEKAVDERAQNIPDKRTREDFLDFISEEYGERIEFHSILLNSFFAASFAMFEHRLYQLCCRAKNDSGNPFSVKDIRGRSSTEQAGKYLTALGIPFPNNTNLWQEIMRYREIRNLIMHEGGRVREREEIKEYALTHGLISPNDGLRELNISRAYCDTAIGNMKIFLLDLIELYNQWLQEQSKEQKDE